MENAKKKISSKKNTNKIVAKKPIVKEATKRKIIIASIISATILLCGAYLVFHMGVPAQVLTGATIAGENVKVNKMNYYFNEVYSTYTQYGIISSKADLDKVYDSSTGQTFREYFYVLAAKNLENIILLNREAKKAGYVPGYAQRSTDEYIQTLREYAKTNNQTADIILKSQYGSGINVRDLKNFKLEELSAQEYAEYLKQTNYNLTEEQMKTKYNAAPQDYDSISFHAFFIKASYDAATATADQKAAAAALAVTKAQGILDAAADVKTFRDASLKAAGTDDISSFDKEADPTAHDKTLKSFVDSYMTSAISDFLFAADRKAGDKKVISSDTGAYAVYFVSRQMDTEASVSYRTLLLTNADVAAAKASAEGYQKSITDEASFIALVKKYSDDSATALAGGLSTNVTLASITTEAPTEQEKALSDWLFSADRKPNDTIVISNVDGVTLYYFQKSLPKWEGALSAANANTEFSNWYSSLASAETKTNLNIGALEFATY